MRSKLSVLSGLVVAAATAVGAPYPPVTDERLENPEPGNWLMYRGTYDSHG